MTSWTPRQHAGRLSPLFRWPGGKRWLIAKLAELLPSTIGRYYEPFLGGAAAFLALSPPAATLSDRNAELIECYQMVRENPDAVSALLTRMAQDESSYYRFRLRNGGTSTERAARFIYLSTLAFNGIYRVNRSGRFNVPYGHRTYSDLGGQTRLRQYAKAFENAELLAADFEVALGSAGQGDFVYLDPPYTVRHTNNGFVKYNARIFSWADQERLADVATRLSARGCHVIVSNASHDSVRRLYAAFEEIPVTRESGVAANPGARGPVSESLFLNWTQKSNPATATLSRPLNRT